MNRIDRRWRGSSEVHQMFRQSGLRQKVYVTRGGVSRIHTQNGEWSSPQRFNSTRKRTQKHGWGGE